jgi:hypothetical protein
MLHPIHSNSLFNISSDIACSSIFSCLPESCALSGVKLTFSLDLQVILDGWVYNLKDFASVHPGGGGDTHSNDIENCCT